MASRRTRSTRKSLGTGATPAAPAAPAPVDAQAAASGRGPAYRRLFSIHEIEQTPQLQWLCAASAFVFFLSFNTWTQRDDMSTAVTEHGGHLCWPYFQSCGDYHFLTALPHGYSQNAFYMLLFALVGGIVIAMLRGRWAWAHAGLCLCLCWAYAHVFVLNAAKHGNYDYYQVILTSALLLLPLKLQFMRIVFVCLYFLSATVKLDPGWVLGTYFSSMALGMPIFHDELIPVMTNTVIFMEMIGCWFLLSKHRLLQRGALGFFILFHLYSGLIVWYRYPATIMPYLLILFAPHPTRFVVPRTALSLPGWGFIAALFALQSVPWLIEGDTKMTLEGNGFGLYMFEANHQCISRVRAEFDDGTAASDERQEASARFRCNPYDFLFDIWAHCRRRPNLTRMHWSFAHSINGGPFYEIVQSDDACALEYSWYRHNDWIKLPERGEARAIGYPVKNIYY